MQPRLILQTDTPDEAASRTTKYLQFVVLRQGVGIDPMSVLIDPVAATNYKLPIMTMGKESMGPWMRNEKRISEFHGHIHFEDGNIVSHTFDAKSVIAQPNYLPIVIQEISNLMRAAKRPELLDRPASIHELVPFLPHEAVVDLEWDSKNRVTVVGFADCGDHAYSTHAVAEGLCVAASMLKQGKRVIGHNIISADLPHIGKPLSYAPEHVFDTIVAAHIVHAHFAQLSLYDLGSLVRYYFPTTDWKHYDIPNVAEYMKSDILTYNSYDCAYNYRLYEALERDLKATGQYHLLQPAQELHALTIEMHKRGIRIDDRGLEVVVNAKMEDKSASRSKLSFNPNSPKQITEWLRAQKIYVPNCEAATLIKLRGRSPEIDALIDYRVDSKSVSTWFKFEADKAGRFISADDFAYPTFHSMGTNVARLSCSGSNFQNLPPSLRHLIVPRSEDLEFVAFDAAQCENRWVAFLADDQEMLAGFDAGIDNHQRVADRISEKFGMSITRNFGKTIVHASNYGEKEFNLSERLFGDRKHENVRKAKALQDAYFAAYPKTRAWQMAISKQLDSGDVKLVNAYGRVRYIYGADSHSRMKFGCHYLGCSSAADMVNQRAIKVWKELGVVTVLIVHDELVFELEKGETKCRTAISEILRERVKEQGNRPGAWEMKVGANYGKLSELNPCGLKKTEMPLAA